jgi:hypothetical protein
MWWIGGVSNTLKPSRKELYSGNHSLNSELSVSDQRTHLAEYAKL